MEYIAITQFISDDIIYENGESYLDRMGGVVYALAGMRYWSRSIGVYCKAGDDFDAVYGRWIADNGIDTENVRRVSGMGPHTRCIYSGSEERQEVPVQGCRSIEEMMLSVDELPEQPEDCKGIYVFLDSDAEYFRELKRWNVRNSKILWEIHGKAAAYENRERVKECLKYVDILAINCVEGERLTRETLPEKIVTELLTMGAKCVFFHRGSDEAYAADKDGCTVVSVYPIQPVDVTGGGNSSSGGFLAGYCESGFDTATAGRCANVSASMVLEYAGVPDMIDAEAEREAARRAAELKTRIVKL